jgi:hypothetical protein
MNQIMILGIILIVFGIGALSYQGLTYTTRDKIIDIGPLEATADTKKTMPLPPIVGGLALASGVGLVIIGRKKP